MFPGYSTFQASSANSALGARYSRRFLLRRARQMNFTAIEPGRRTPLSGIVHSTTFLSSLPGVSVIT